MGGVSVERYIKVWDDEYGVCLMIGPDADTGMWPMISTPDKKSEEFYGPLRLTLSPNFALKLAAALIEIAEHCARNERQPEKH